VYVKNLEYGNTDVIINTSAEIDSVDPSKIRVMIEVIIRIVYMNLVGKQVYSL
jgi:hypothetical protein